MTQLAFQASEDFFDLDGEDAAELDGALEPLEDELTENGNADNNNRADDKGLQVRRMTSLN